jgi:predicted molibdopterin-dependent oxidoreductase YjgC
MIVDDRMVDAVPGVSVLDAAGEVGITIPVICYHPSLPPDGSCRMCVVEIQRRPGLHAACVVPATDDLVVHTDTPAVREARRHLLRLLLGTYRPGTGKEPNELLALAARLDVTAPPSVGGPPAAVDESNPFIRVDHGACIRCWRCVRACDRLNGVTAIGVFGRGADARIGFGADGPMQDSTCEFCGMCEAVCPTDALTARLRPTTAGGTASTICSYCGVGCRLTLQVAEDRIVGTIPDWGAPANHGLLCVKGRFGWPYVHDPARLTRPLVRRSLLGGDGEEFVETDWGTALDLVAGR